jgi:hypothetical protein
MEAKLGVENENQEGSRKQEAMRLLGAVSFAPCGSNFDVSF